jgi:D-3-phosphoglycerate dehydrogenase
VFETEPKAAGEPFSSSLQGLPNVILTPHVGGSTEEAQEDIGRFVAGKLRDFASGGSTTMSVNLPQVQADDGTGRYRILHVHHNVPGVLATMNGVLADFGVNIEGQVLSTRGQLGYVVTDAGGPLSAALLDKLESLPETVRLRASGPSAA